MARLDVLPFAGKAAVHYGQVRAELERAGTPCGPHNNMREFVRMPGIRAENWL